MGGGVPLHPQIGPSMTMKWIYLSDLIDMFSNLKNIRQELDTLWLLTAHPEYDDFERDFGILSLHTEIQETIGVMNGFKDESSSHAMKCLEIYQKCENVVEGKVTQIEKLTKLLHGSTEIAS